MALDDLNEKIHSRDFQDDRIPRTEYDPGGAVRPNEQVAFEADSWHAAQPESWPRRFLDGCVKFLAAHWKKMAVVASVLVIGGLLVNFVLIRAFLFENERVTLEIAGPTDVASAEAVRYVVRYGNDNLFSANDAELILSFPGEFKVEAFGGVIASGNTATIRLGDIGGRSAGTAEFSGKFYGSRGTPLAIRAVIRFTPSGTSGRYETEARKGVTIGSSALAVEAAAPQELASGGEVEYVVTYRNESDLSFSNLRLKAEYPDGFQFLESAPRADEGNALWRVGNLLPRASGEVRIKGTISGSRDQAKILRVSIGIVQGDGTFVAYDQEERLTRMVASPLSIIQTVNGKTDISVNPGDALNYELRFVNEGTIGVRDAIVTAEIDPAYLNISGLSLSSGAYDQARRIITWKASDVPQLASLEPRQGGSIRFSVPVKERIDASGGTKDIFIRTIAKIDSPDVPFFSPTNKIIASNTLQVRIGAVVEYDVAASYGSSVIPNAGPIPPKVGMETTYTLRFKATNYLNDLAKANVTMMLPTAVRYTGKKSPDTEAVSYNDRTGELVWDIGNIWGGGKGVRELTIQIAITPGLNEVGTSPTLLLRSVFQAEDTFTKNPVRIERGMQTTHIAGDPSIGNDGYNVVP